MYIYDKVSQWYEKDVCGWPRRVSESQVLPKKKVERARTRMTHERNQLGQSYHFFW